VSDPRSDDRRDLDRAFQGLYDEMYRIAARQFGRERAGHTLQPTAVVAEAYIKLAGQSDLPDGRRSEMLGIAAHAMRQVLIDHARRHRAEKRGGDRRRTTLGDPGFEVDLDDVITAAKFYALLGKRMLTEQGAGIREQGSASSNRR